MNVILKKYVLAKVDKNYIGIKRIDDEVKKGLLIENNFRELPIEELFLGLFCSIKKKDEIIQISFVNDSLYITSYKNEATFYDELDIVIEEYILYSDLKEDKKFIAKINELIKEYEEVKEETAIIFSEKMMNLSLDKFVKENVIFFIEEYLKFSLTNKINDKELTTIIISYVENHRGELLEKVKNMKSFNNFKLLQLLEAM